MHCNPACRPNPDAAAFPFCRMTVSTVSITFRPSTRSLVPSDPTCSPPSLEDEFLRRLPEKAPVWENGSVRMVFTMEVFLLHRMQPQCKTSGLLLGQEFCLMKIKPVAVLMCNGPRRPVLTAQNKADKGLFYSHVRNTHRLGRSKASCVIMVFNTEPTFSLWLLTWTVQLCQGWLHGHLNCWSWCWHFLCDC